MNESGNLVEQGRRQHLSALNHLVSRFDVGILESSILVSTFRLALGTNQSMVWGGRSRYGALSREEKGEIPFLDSKLLLTLLILLEEGRIICRSTREGLQCNWLNT